ncbi:hypothetical protein EWB00_004956 [Schistosoma japonicum]|uniref:PHD-type domain-containing protein n=1 Tax=Schistosoma japonicum TaxID=6182 RepID=A0A4Z2D3G9_SCHJA|nr:hypothetical protein EWB00_004956 [Schistosoma japonicum]
MTLNLQYSHSTTPIAEAWLIKALRLVYSKKPGDRDKLRKLYKDACDNESQILHMTLAEALREPRECISTNHDTSERDTSTSMHSTQRIRTSQSINDLPSLPSCICTTTPTISNANDSTSLVNVTHNETSVYATSTTTSVISSDRLVNTTTNNSGILNSTVIGTTSHSSSTVTNRANKRNKVAFFNIFDVASSTSNSSTSSNTTVVSSKTNIQQRSSNQLENTISVESINSNTTVQLCNNTEVTVDSFINNSATGTSKIQINSELSNPIIDLTLTDNDVLSTSTTSTDTNCTLSLSDDKLSTTKVMNSNYLPTVSQTQSSSSSSSSSFTSSVDSTMISNDTLIASNQENSNLNTNNAHLLLAASLVADLVCRLCGRLSQQPQLEPDKKTINANVLVECLKCGSLYHQLCHQPFILMSTPKQQWICANCSIISTTSIVTTADPLIISTSSITSFNSTMNLTSSINSTCNVLSTDSMISCNVIESSDILSTDMTVITGNDHNDSSSSSSSSFSSSSVILSNPVPVSSSSTISTITTLSLLPTTAIATNQLCLSSSSPPLYPPSSSSSSSSTTTTTITSTIPSTSTINIGARKRKPAFTSPLSSLPRKLKDDYN